MKYLHTMVRVENIKDSLDFSFSGLKTAVLRRAQDRGLYPSGIDTKPNSLDVANIASSFQDAVVDVLVQRTVQAAEHYKVKGVLLGGGVAANLLLREEMKINSPVPVIVPRPSFCTDNGAMIGAAAYFRFLNGLTYQWDLDVLPALKLA